MFRSYKFFVIFYQRDVLAAFLCFFFKLSVSVLGFAGNTKGDAFLIGDREGPKSQNEECGNGAGLMFHSLSSAFLSDFDREVGSVQQQN